MACRKGKAVMSFVKVTSARGKLLKLTQSSQKGNNLQLALVLTTTTKCSFAFIPHLTTTGQGLAAKHMKPISITSQAITNTSLNITQPHVNYKRQINLRNHYLNLLRSQKGGLSNMRKNHWVRRCLDVV